MYNEGPSLVIAGAGSGKTRVLTYKVAYLMHIGLEPHRILALTFTNKAASEMKQRIARMVDAQQARYLQMGTFHSIFSRILRSEASVIGLSSDYSVYDTDDSKRLIRNIVKEMNLDEKTYAPGGVWTRISHAKNDLVSAEDYASSDYDVMDARNGQPYIQAIYRQYTARCRQANAIDFDDMLMLTFRMFRQHPEVLEKYQNLFQFILVDEYQDTNRVQAQIVQMLAAKHHRVCVVGDDAQSIYSFRGANIGNILQFRKIYPEAKLFKLERNYRSTQHIVNAAGSLIARNKEQIRKDVYSEREAGEPVRVYEVSSDRDEASLIARQLASMHRTKGYSYAQMAVLYRNNAQSRQIEDACRAANIPYRIRAGVSFYQRKEVKDVLAYLRLIQNPADEEAFLRIVNYPARGIGDTTVGKLSEAAHLHGLPLYEVALTPLKYGVNVNAGTQGKIAAFTDLIGSLALEAGQMSLSDFVMAVVERTGILNALNEEPEAESLKQNIEEIVNMVHEYEESKLEQGDEPASLTDFLIEAALLTDADSDDENDPVERVTLMTIHAAKGLEFKVVVVAGVEENLLPSNRALEEPGGVEEERRLMYVAITRAEDQCILTWAKQRFTYGKPAFPQISRFLKEMNPKFLSFHQEGGARYGSSLDFSRRDYHFFSKPAAPAVSVPKPQSSVTGKRLVKIHPQAGATAGAAAKAADLQVGMRIRHGSFGDGEILEIDQASSSPRIKVRFDVVGEKTLLLQFAKFERL